MELSQMEPGWMKHYRTGLPQSNLPWPQLERPRLERMTGRSLAVVTTPLKMMALERSNHLSEALDSDH